MIELSTAAVVAAPVGIQTAATQDLSLVVADSVPAGDVLATVIEGTGPLLEHASLVDDYRGSGLAEGTKSLTFALRFRAPERRGHPGARAARRSAPRLTCLGVLAQTEAQRFVAFVAKSCVEMARAGGFCRDGAETRAFFHTAMGGVSRSRTNPLGSLCDHLSRRRYEPGRPSAAGVPATPCHQRATVGVDSREPGE